MATADQVPLETATLSYIADQHMKRAMIELLTSSGSLKALDRTLALARAITEFPFELNLWQAQNIWYEILRTLGGSGSTAVDLGRTTAVGEGLLRRTRRVPDY